MSNIKTTLATLFSQAISTSFGAEFADVDPAIHIASRPEFGDYQANFALSLAKRQKMAPLVVANKVIEAFKAHSAIASLSVSGPGFINITLADDFLNKAIQILVNDAEFDAIKTHHPKTIMVEYGSANVAKEMHVGHLRSAVIGDAIARVLSFIGHHVIRQNHLGDWGTQFGMLIEHSLDEQIDLNIQAAMSDLNTLYKQAKEKFDANENFADRARNRVVLLQSGDLPSLKIWRALVNQSEIYFQAVYERLDVLLTPQDNRGESFYNPFLPAMVKELLVAGVAQPDQGAIVIPLPHFIDQNNQPLPMLIRKTDGGYLYATTDLAAVRFRFEDLQADSLIYVVDARQKLHFDMLFAASKQAGWVTASGKFNHLAFGTVLGVDKKPFKTRSGDTIKLIDLLNEAENRALKVMEARHSPLTQQEKQHVAHIIGIGALKYADLANDLTRDYVFDWDHMLSFEGNTAPYLQNAYVRIQSIFRKGEIKHEELAEQVLRLTTPEEHALAIKVLEFSSVVHTVATDLRPHKLCTYLFELASKFHHFYETNPILNAEVEQRHTRLLLSNAVAKVLKTGLGLLGIHTLERM